MTEEKKRITVGRLRSMVGTCFRKTWGKLEENATLLGIASLLWLVFRTGTKPLRIVYPCQRAAAANSFTLFTSLMPSSIAAVQSKTRKSFNLKKEMAVVLIVLAMGAAVWWGIQQWGKGPISPISQTIGLTLEPRSATAWPASDIFVVNGTTGQDEGLSELINLMGSHGLLFYQSGTNGSNQGPSGLIARDDVVLIKVNCQWNARGGTNTDLLKGLIQMIVAHPDGFTGEIVVADNGQGRGSLDWPDSNAEDHSQSAQTVVNMFSDSYKVSTFLWNPLTIENVSEYSSGDMSDGYVVSQIADPDTGMLPSYPKFETAFDTYISFKEGIWDPVTRSYDPKRLKMINVPVLKSHSSYGVTACVKHYMGVQSGGYPQSGLSNGHDTVGRGGMGTEMVETRFPVLNILDAIWVNANPTQSFRTGPNTPYGYATRVNVIMSSTDPVALDYWAAKHVLVQTAILKGENDTASLDPDNPERVYGLTESFHVWLELSMNEMLEAGYQVTMNENHMNVYVVNMPETTSSSYNSFDQTLWHEFSSSRSEIELFNQVRPALTQNIDTGHMPRKRP